MATITGTDLNHEELEKLLDALEDKKNSEQANLDMDDEAYLEDRSPEEVKESIKMLTNLIHKFDRLYLQ